MTIVLDKWIHTSELPTAVAAGHTAELPTAVAAGHTAELPAAVAVNHKFHEESKTCR